MTGQNQTVVARYDYLPFGEEVGAGVGSRTTAMGYGGAENEEYRQYVCGKESEHPLDSWTLKNRPDEPEQVKLFYWHWRTDSDTHDRLWIAVEKRDEQWHVTNYECIY